jgi:predicted dehydrogenase
MNTYRVGLIGCGGIFPMHAFPLHMMENIEVKAVCDNKPDALSSAYQLFNCEGYEDYHDLLQRDDVDVVHVLTPHNLHAPMAVAAANAGKHVLIEKPMSITIEGARAILEAGKRNGVTIGVISQNRYNTASVAVKEAIASGSLGKVIGQRIFMPWHKPPEYFLNSDWRGTWDKEGGSLLIDAAIHVMDLARWFVDEEIESIQATIANRNHPEAETEDTAEGLITYCNGVKSVFMGTNNFSFNSATEVETHCERGIAVVGLMDAVITYKDGREATVVSDPTETIDEAAFKEFFKQEPAQLAFQTLKAWGVIFPPIMWKARKVAFGITHFKQIENFYASLDAGVQPDISAEIAFKTQEMICAIYQAAKENREIKLR